MGDSILAQAFREQSKKNTQQNKKENSTPSALSRVFLEHAKITTPKTTQTSNINLRTEGSVSTPNYGQGNIDLNSNVIMPNVKKKYTIYNDTANGKKVVIPMYDTSLSAADAITHTGLTQEQAEEQYRSSGKYYAQFDAPEIREASQVTPLSGLQQIIGGTAQNGTEPSGSKLLPNVDTSKLEPTAMMPWIKPQGEARKASEDKAQAFIEEMEYLDFKNGKKVGKLTMQELSRYMTRVEQEEITEKTREIYKDADSNVVTAASLAGVSGANNFIDGLLNVGSVPYLDNTHKATVEAIQTVAAEERMEMGSVAGFFFDMTQNMVQNAPAMAAGLVGGKAASFMTTYLSSYGRSKKYAEQSGYEGAAKYAYAVLNGLQEAGLDYVGRMPGGGNLTGAIADTLTKNITKSVVKYGAKLAISMAGEGITEMFQETIDNGLKNVLFGEKNDTSLFTEEALYAGLLGAATGGLFETVDIASEVISKKRAEATERKAEKQAVKKMIKDLAVETGTKYGVSEEVYTDVAEVASELGRPVRFASDEELQIVREDGTVSVPTGRYDHNSKTIVLSAKLSKQEAIEYVIKHELAHSIQNTSQWTQLERAVRTNMTEVAFEEAVQVKTKQYAEKGVRLDPTRAEQAVVADWIGDNLYNGRFFEAVKGGDATGGNVVRRTIDRVRLALGGVKNSRTAGDIALLERAFMRGVKDKSTRPDSRFLLKQLVEEANDLIAIHNLSEEQLMELLEKGGVEMPSVAVTNQTFDPFGECSLIVPKDSIDPVMDERNKLYGSDAWTQQKSELKINAKFDEEATESFLNGVRTSIGDQHAGELFNVSVEQFTGAIRQKDGSFFDAYKDNVGIQTAYALQNGLIDTIPTHADGRVDLSALRGKLDNALHKDAVWREYRRWMSEVSDGIITDYDQATTDDIMRNMQAQQHTAKPFKLFEDGALTVPAVEYTSVEDFKKNKSRLQKDAAASAQAVGERFLNWAEDVRNGKPLSTVVSAINDTFVYRYDREAIVDSFAQAGIELDGRRAYELQELYKEAVELNTPYFEAKAERFVPLKEFAGVVVPTTMNENVKQQLLQSGIRVVEYDPSVEGDRTRAVNTFADQKFGLDGYDLSQLSTNAVSEQVEKQSSYELSDNFGNQLNDWLAGGGKAHGSFNGEYFDLGTTPGIFIKHGARELKVIMTPDCLVKITGDKHSISLDEIAKLPLELNDPVLLFKGNSPNSFVALTELKDKQGNDVVAIVHINRHQKRLEVNRIASLYSKSDAYGNNRIIAYVNRQIANGNLVDASSKKAPMWFTNRGRQLPKLVQTIIDANTIKAQNSFGVNSNDMQNGEKNSRSSADFYGTFVGDEGITEKSYNSQAVGKVSNVNPQDTSFIKYIPKQFFENSSIIDSDSVHHHAMERVKQMPREKTVANGKTIAELEQELSEQELFNRAFMSEVIDRPPVTIDIDGQAVDTAAYMDAVEEMLPDDEAGIQSFIQKIGEQKATELSREYAEKGEIGEKTLPIDIQLFAAERKLERIRLLAGEENGTQTRRFFEQRLKNMDANDAHSAELIEFLSGRSEKYTPIANEKTYEAAQRKLRRDGGRERRKLERRIMRHRAGFTMNAVDLAAAQIMINDARNDGDIELYADLIQGVSRYGTDLGRAVQILSLQRRLTPEGTIKAAQRTMRKAIDGEYGEGTSESIDQVSGDIVDAIERAEVVKVEIDLSIDQLEDALGDAIVADKSPYITEEEIRGIIHRAVDTATDMSAHLKKMIRSPKIQKTLAEKIVTIQRNGHLTDAKVRGALEEALGLPTLSSADVQKLVELTTQLQELESGTLEYVDKQEEIYRFLGEKLPVTRLEAMMAWGKFAMLANPKTHLRNILSNIVMQKGINKMDDAVATVLQKVFIRDISKRTALIGWRGTTFGKQLVKSGRLEIEAEKALAQLRGSQKYEMTDRKLGQYKKMFERLFGKKVGKFFDNLNDVNSNWLETEDAKAFMPAFTDALGQVMTVRKTNEITDEIFDIAFQKAAETVFRAQNALGDVLLQLKDGMFNINTPKGRKMLGYITDIVMPFAKTPANIAVVSFQHSPLGVVQGGIDLFKRSVKAKTAKTTVEIINEFSKGITGTALAMIGILLGKAGLFNTKYGKTEKERAADELAGIQENALVLPEWMGGFSITLDWLQPSVAPLIFGASIGQRVREEGIEWNAIGMAFLDSTDTMFELTMLQSLYDVLGGYDAGASASAFSVGENFVSQRFPTLMGQVARAIDPVQRKTKGENDFQTMINQVLAKIPLATYFLEPEMDVWGNEVYRTGQASIGGVIANAIQQFLLPANIKIPVKGDDVYSNLILEMYNSDTATKPGRAIPTAVSRDDAREMGVAYEDLYRVVAKEQREKLAELVSGEKTYTVQVENAYGKKRNTQKRWSEMTEDERLRVMERIYRDVKERATDPDGDLYAEIIRRYRNAN